MLFRSITPKCTSDHGDPLCSYFVTYWERNGGCYGLVYSFRVYFLQGRSESRNSRRVGVKKSGSSFIRPSRRRSNRPQTKVDGGSDVQRRIK